jgi:hypothetical protein
VKRSTVVWVVAGSCLAWMAAAVLLNPARATEDAWLLLIAPPFLAVGALLAWKRPRNPIGWLFFAFGVGASVDFAAFQWAYRAVVDEPGSLPAGNLAVSIAGHLWHPSFELFVLSFLLFPNGRLLSPRWRWVAWAAIANGVVLLLLAPFESGFVREEFPTAKPLIPSSITPVADHAWGVLLPLTILMLVAAGVSLVLRLRRSHGEERQHIKWFVIPIAFIMFAFPIPLVVVGEAYGVSLFPLIPVAAAVAILKYRLYDIDVVVNRTLVYGSLTATLAAVYLGSVLLLQLALDSVTSGSGLAVAVSTLAVAALFRPARARIQTAVDHRFYRRKYDAAHTLEEFSARLREQVDLETLGGELREVVRDTMQPVHVSVWLRKAER